MTSNQESTTVEAVEFKLFYNKKTSKFISENAEFYERASSEFVDIYIPEIEEEFKKYFLGIRIWKIMLSFYLFLLPALGLVFFFGRRPPFRYQRDLLILLGSIIFIGFITYIYYLLASNAARKNRFFSFLSDLNCEFKDFYVKGHSQGITVCFWPNPGSARNVKVSMDLIGQRFVVSLPSYISAQEKEKIFDLFTKLELALRNKDHLSKTVNIFIFVIFVCLFSLFSLGFGYFKFNVFYVLLCFFLILVFNFYFFLSYVMLFKVQEKYLDRVLHNANIKARFERDQKIMFLPIRYSYFLFIDLTKAE